MSRYVNVQDLAPDEFNRYREVVTKHPHERAAARAVFRAGLDVLAPQDATTAEVPVAAAEVAATPEQLAAPEPKRARAKAEKPKARKKKG